MTLYKSCKIYKNVCTLQSLQGQHVHVKIAQVSKTSLLCVTEMCPRSFFFLFPFFCVAARVRTAYLVRTYNRYKCTLRCLLSHVGSFLDKNREFPRRFTHRPFSQVNSCPFFDKTTMCSWRDSPPNRSTKKRDVIGIIPIQNCAKLPN